VHVGGALAKHYPNAIPLGQSPIRCIIPTDAEAKKVAEILSALVNKAILDYVLLHFPYVGGRTLRFYEQGHPIHKIERFETFDELARSLVRRVKKATRSTPAKQQRSKVTVLGARHERLSRARQY
jgi:hypothetical protein